MGRIIGKRYEIQHELGAGGMGTVFLGLDSQLGKSVAIKQLKLCAKSVMPKRLKMQVDLWS